MQAKLFRHISQQDKMHFPGWCLQQFLHSPALQQHQHKNLNKVHKLALLLHGPHSAAMHLPLVNSLMIIKNLITDLNFIFLHVDKLIHFPKTTNPAKGGIVENYFTNLNSLFHLGPLSQLNQISHALPTILSSGTKPQKRLSCELCLLSPIIQ